jgi:hypothetical protein
MLGTMLAVLMLMLPLKLVLLVLFRVCGYEGILFGEHTNYASSDFMTDNCFVFAYNIDPEFL